MGKGCVAKLAKSGVHGELWGMPEAPVILRLVVWASSCHLVSKETVASVLSMKGIFLPAAILFSKF